MRVIEINADELDPDVIELLELSGKLRSKEQVMRQIVLDALDPLVAFGPEFEFEDRPDDEAYISIEVPGPCSRVDLAQAWVVAQLDARACELVLEADDSADATIRVLRNQHQWLAFWAHRFPNDQFRARFAAQLEDRRTALERLKSAAGQRMQFGLVSELKTI